MIQMPTSVLLVKTLTLIRRILAHATVRTATMIRQAPLPLTEMHASRIEKGVAVLQVLIELAVGPQMLHPRLLQLVLVCATWDILRRIVQLIL